MFRSTALEWLGHDETQQSTHLVHCKSISGWHEEVNITSANRFVTTVSHCNHCSHNSKNWRPDGIQLQLIQRGSTISRSRVLVNIEQQMCIYKYNYRVQHQPQCMYGLSVFEHELAFLFICVSLKLTAKFLNSHTPSPKKQIRASCAGGPWDRSCIRNLEEIDHPRFPNLPGQNPQGSQEHPLPPLRTL